MSKVLMDVLQRQVESLSRQVSELNTENERVRKLLTEFDERHDRDQAELERLKAIASEFEQVIQSASNGRTLYCGTYTAKEYSFTTGQLTRLKAMIGQPASEAD